MADQARRYTILGFGEEYRAPIEKKGRPSQGTPHVRSLAEAQTMLAPRISSVVTAVRSLPNEQRLDEVVIELRLQGVVSPRDGWKLPFLLPPDFEAGGMVRFEWTIVLSPDVDFASPDEYTLVGIEFAFRPHSDIFTFNPPKGSMEKPVKLNILTEAKQCQELKDKGWKRSLLPVSDSKPGKNEHVLRSTEGKWETVVRDSRRKQPTHLSEPMLTLSVVGRGAWDRKDPNLQSRYAAILTVDAPKYKGDLYGQVLRTFDRLRPLRLRQQLQVR